MISDTYEELKKASEQATWTATTEATVASNFTAFTGEQIVATVTSYYLDGIREGRETFKREGMQNAAAHLDNLRETIKGFDAGSPVGQMLRGERDFWLNQIKQH